MRKLKQWIRARRHPVARMLFTLHRAVRTAESPVIPGLHTSLYRMDRAVRNGWEWMIRVFWRTPLFKSRLSGPAPRLFLYSGMPFVGDGVRIRIGSDCRLSGALTITGRSAGRETPELVIGNNVGISWQTTISVGTKVVMEDNVRLAGRSYLGGYPGHPVNAADRAAGLPDTEDQIGDIVLEQDVWLGMGVQVMSGVRIGRGTIVAAGAVVTKDLPAGVLAGGVPAKVIRVLAPKEVAA